MRLVTNDLESRLIIRDEWILPGTITGLHNNAVKNNNNNWLPITTEYLLKCMYEEQTNKDNSDQSNRQSNKPQIEQR